MCGRAPRPLAQGRILGTDKGSPEEPKRPAPAAASSPRRRRWPWVVVPLLAIFLFIFLYYGSGKWPRYVWYTVRADFEVDGEIVPVGGSVQCERASLFQFVFIQLGLPYGSSTVPYRVSTSFFARRLESGGVLIVQPNLTCQQWSQRGLEEHFPEGYRPLVAWLDDPERPTRAERYFSNVYFRQPDARVRFLGFEAEYEGSGPVAYSMIYGNRRAAALLRELPWLETRTPSAFRGYNIKIVERDRWESVPGLEETLRQFDEPSILSRALPFFDDSNRRAQGQLNQVFSSRSLRGCEPLDTEATGACDPLRHVYGMIPNPDGLGARFADGEGTVGYLSMVPWEWRLYHRPTYRFEIAGAVFDDAGVGRNFYVFDPTSSRLYEIDDAVLRIRGDSPRAAPRLSW